MTPELKQFLTEWLAWAEAGAPEHGKFSNYGLCNNSQNYLFSVGQELTSVLSADFSDNYDWPFNENLGEYLREVRRSKVHLNPARLAWVRAKLGEAA